MLAPMTPEISILSRIASSLSAFRAELLMRRRLRHLTDMPPTLLLDMGLTRADLIAALRTPLSHSATRALTERLTGAR